MSDDTKRREHLLQLRDELFAEMHDAELAFARLRVKVELMESSLRIGLPEPPDFVDVKGHQMPQAEGRVLGLFRDLLKLEDKINALREGTGQS